MSTVQALQQQLGDRRSRKVVFLAHCLLNENTRYLGGACTGGCVRGIVEQCLDQGIGIVQLPCPEQAAWGGVLKRRMLRLYGNHSRVVRTAAYTLGVAYTRLVYRRLARQIARQIEDYTASGFTVVGIVGVDGSPSCGVSKTLDLGGALDAMAALDPRHITVAQQNAMVRDHVKPGRGIFIEELDRALRRRNLAIPLSAHDLIEELAGHGTLVTIRA